MTDPVKSTDPARRMGVYKRLSDVPNRYRLYQHAEAYSGRDVWAEWIDEEGDLRDLSTYYIETTETAERSWKAHMDDRGRHHALATPEDIEAWVTDLTDSRQLRTVYERYWIRLEQFYEWLQAHAEHPHVYHPVLMAAAECEAAGRVWDRKIQAGRKRARKRAEEGRQ